MVSGAAVGTAARPDCQSGRRLPSANLPHILKAGHARYHTFMGQYLAFDLGAESGRAIIGNLFGGRLVVEELHRFPNTPVREGDSLCWDTERLWHEIRS